VLHLVHMCFQIVTALSRVSRDVRVTVGVSRRIYKVPLTLLTVGVPICVKQV